MSELLEKIPPETCWAITAKILSAFFVMRGEKIIVHFLGMGEEITAPVLAKEKWQEINEKLQIEGGRQFYTMVKERFNIPVEDAIGAEKLAFVAWTLYFGPKWKVEMVEATPERVVVRTTNCPIWERCRENELEPVLMACPAAHKVWVDEGLKAINPKIAFKLTKAMPRGDPYCEQVIEFKEA